MQLTNVVNNQAYKAIVDNINYQDFFYEPLILIAQKIPYNKECSISLKTIPSYDFESKFIALSTGYIYHKKSLFSWFEESQNFIDPMTNRPLPQTDITRIIKLKKGLQNIVDLQENFNKEKNRLLAQQDRALSMPYLSRTDQIKNISFYSLRLIMIVVN